MKKGPFSRLLEKSRYLVVLPVISSLIASFSAMIWGAFKTGKLVKDLILLQVNDDMIAIKLISIMDTLLIATALYIFAVGLYELFVKDLDLPHWLTIRNLYDLKFKLGSVVVLVMSILFLEHLVEWNDPKGILLYGISISLVTASLTLFIHFMNKHSSK